MQKIYTMQRKQASAKLAINDILALVLVQACLLVSMLDTTQKFF